MEAAYYEIDPSGQARCRLCPHHCHIAQGHRGRCQTRYYDGRNLQALNYGQCTAIALDPIEKKPLYRFHPGSAILSLGSWGCNFTCPFCQNWQISQQEAPFRELTPEQALLPYIDAWNIDLKGFSQDFYQSLCGASLQPVLDTIEAAAAVSHVEVTTLVIPGENDDPAQMDAEARWLASILPDIPLHLTRYFPQYHWSAPVTPVETLKKLQAVASSYLHYIYLGNV